MRALRRLAVAVAVGAWVVILIGGYVSATGSGLGCPELIACGDAPNPTKALIESSHRVAAWVEGLLVLGMFVLVLARYREWRTVRNLTAIAFVLVAVQATLGILAVAMELDPLVVTAHLGVATAFLAVAVLNAAVVLRGPPADGHPSEPPTAPGPPAR